jgi:hypothetical protein
MMRWMANMCCYLALGLPGEVWRAIFGKDLLRRWWDSHYR